MCKKNKEDKIFTTTIHTHFHVMFMFTLLAFSLINEFFWAHFVHVSALILEFTLIVSSRFRVPGSMKSVFKSTQYNALRMYTEM